MRLLPLVSALALVLGLGAKVPLVNAASVTAPPNTLATDFSLKDLEGKVRSLKAEKGKVVVLNFWATWCGPCRIELPKVHELYLKLKGQKFTVFAIAVDNEQTVGSVKPLVAKSGFTFPVLLDVSNDVVNVYNTQGIIPYTVVIDHKGNIRYVHEGYEPGDEKVLEKEIQELLKQAGSSSPAKKSTASPVGAANRK